jgi:metallo-beta-lactamase superfamily protein
MKLVLRALVVLLGLTWMTASAQDARAILQASAAAMGLNSVKTIQYTATGWNALVGQSFNLEEDWPRFEVTAYSRTIDYDANASREDFTRRRGNYPMRGGGAPFDGDQRVVQIVSGGYAWNMQGEKPALPGRPYLEVMPHNELRQLEIVLTPHGFLKAAMASKDVRVMSTAIVGPTNAGLTENGRRANLVAFTALGKYKVVGTINDQNLVELTTTWIPNAVYGDMLYEIRHLNYKDFGGVKFPTTIHVHQGDPVFNPAHNMMEIRVSDVRTNVPVPAMPVPDNIRQATVPAVRADAQKVADGVWFIGGGSHNSVAVEFNDHIAMIEAPLNEERSLAVLDAVAKVAPNKLVRYIINTHHHFDHSSGLRTYIAQGSTLVTHRDNADFYEQVLLSPAPRTLMPDRLAMFYPNFTASRRPVPIERVNQKYVLSDGVRTLELHPVQGSTHIGPMLIAYLPKEKILVNADLYTPPAPGAQIPSQAMQGIQTLARNIERLKLDVVQHVTLHGMPGPHDAFLKLAAVATKTN